MQNSQTTSPAAEKPEVNVQPDLDAPFKPISDFVMRPDFPECALGERVDIGGYTGVVVAVVKKSLKVRSPEGVTRSFNSYGLQRIYAPPSEPAPAPLGPSTVPILSSEEIPPSKGPPRQVIDEPNFKQPVVPIGKLVTHPSFPQCAFGQQVDIGGYTGVVVEIIKQSLKVRSHEGRSRNYNGAVLRKLYGP